MSHWTNDSENSFAYSIGADFMLQLENKMHSDGISQTELARRLGVTPGRVSNILSNPGRMTIRTIVKLARALQLKVSIVAYDDHDPANENGLVSPQIFVACWEVAGRPNDFFGFQHEPKADQHKTIAADAIAYAKTVQVLAEDMARDKADR